MFKFALAAAASLLTQPLIAQEGLTLFQPVGSTTAVLINQAGQTVHSWVGDATPAVSVYLMPCLLYTSPSPRD